MNPFSQDASEEIKKSLFHNAMKSNWDDVIKTYRQNVSAHTAKITSSGDTALHIAISNGEESVVEELVAIAGDTPGALETKNELGNTPLHLAAYLGNARMCRCVAHRDTALMGIRNGDNETPFFLTVRHGWKEAFRALHSVCRPEEGYSYCRGKDGETILHSAISGEYFDLAFEIMNEYKRLLNAVNEQGFSPLHILANKPSAFRSGSHIRGLNKLIYHCIFVDELQLKTTHALGADLLHYNKATAMYPENYHTCVGVIYLLRNIRRVLLGDSNELHDEEENMKDQQHEADHAPNLKVSSRANAERLQAKGEILLPKSISNRTPKLIPKPKSTPTEHQNPSHFAFCRILYWNSFKAAASSRNHEFLPKNCMTFYNFIKLISKAMLVILGLGSKAVEKIREKKAKHIWSLQIMDNLLDHASFYEYENNGRSPVISGPGKDSQRAIPYTLSDIATDFDRTDEGPIELQKPPTDKLLPCRELLKALGLVKGKAALMKGDSNSALDMEKKETPILIAAKNGVVEIVEGILERFPAAIHDMNSEKKNVILLAVEHRQPHVYKMLVDRKLMKETIFRKTDTDGNSALHLAARLGEYRPWLIPGAALQMQWEIKWYEFVKDSMPLHFFPRYNNESKTPREIFTATHGELAKEGGEWLTSTSESCSVVAALIATVAFATSATVPGGVKSDDSGTPTLLNETAFGIFAISSLVALCFSVTSVVMFLAILTSRYQEKDFGSDLPRKLLVGLTSLFISIGSMLLSFCAGHFFVLKEKLQYAAFPMYAITCLPVTFFAAAQFPLYFDLVWATIRKVPQRSSK